MILKKKYTVLYMSYDGILENLGQSQILPLLKKLSKNWNLILMTFEKKADLKVKKSGAKWYKRLRPQVRAKMKDAYKTRMGKGSTSVIHDED